MITLTKRFVASSLAYLIIGHALGVVYLVKPDLIPHIRPIHTHITLLGGVSFLIMGITYFVIPIFIRKKAFSEKAVNLHFIMANTGLVGMIISLSLENYSGLSFFSIIEVISSYLFLFNIVSTAVKGEAVVAAPEEGSALIMRGDRHTDRWAALFTQVSVIYFVLGCTIGGFMADDPSKWGYLKAHFHINLLGWVTMMIYGVAYHLFPRFSGSPVKNKSLVKYNFYVANTGLIIMSAALVYRAATGSETSTLHAIITAGIIESAAALMFVYNIMPCVKGSLNKMSRPSLLFIRASITYLVIGILFGAYMAFNPKKIEMLIPIHAHLNLLGWVMMMIFGVGYYIIPAVAGRKLFSLKMARVQFWIANSGLIGFLIILPQNNGDNKPALMIFAILIVVSILLFTYNIVKSGALNSLLDRT